MRKILLLLVLLALPLFLFGCAGKSGSHSHLFEEKLSYNDEFHFHKCTVSGCTELSGSEKHSFLNMTSCGPDSHSGSCACGYTLTVAHSWNDGIITKNPTETEAGQRVYTCIFCGATHTEEIEKLSASDSDTDGTPPEHKHILGDYLWDEIYHWKLCADASCGQTVDKNEHSFGDGAVTKEPTKEQLGEITYTCTVCGKTKTEPKDYVVSTTVTEEEWVASLARDNFTATVTSVVFGVSETKLLKRDGDKAEEILIAADTSLPSYRIRIDGVWYGIVNGTLVSAELSGLAVGRVLLFELGEFSDYEYSPESGSYKSDSAEVFFEDGYIVKVVFEIAGAVFTVEYLDYGKTEIYDFPEYSKSE